MAQKRCTQKITQFSKSDKTLLERLKSSFKTEKCKETFFFDPVLTIINKTMLKE